MTKSNKTQVQVSFSYERETKRKYRFQEIDPSTNELKEMADCDIGTLYVSKSVFNNVIPDNVVVTIETV